MKIQITITTTQVEKKEIKINLPVCIKTSDYEMAKVISENELIRVNIWGSINIARIEVSDISKNVFTNDYEIIPESEFQSHLNKAKQIIDEAYNKAVIKLKVVVFGERNDYKAGEVVVWNGKKPCICKIKDRSEYSGTSCFASTSNTHNSLHYLYLRPATSEEIELLGENEIHYL